MHYALILNPAARHGATGRRRADVEAACRAAGLGVTVWRTEAPGHAVVLAQEAAAQADAVIACGGDGTVHEVSRGLLAAGAPVPLGVLPLGTGNDFALMLGMPRRLRAAAEALAGATVRRIDHGRVAWDEAAVRREATFVNAVGVGVDAQTAHDAARYKALPGVVGYLAAALGALRRWPDPVVRITDAASGAVLHDGPLLLATAGNGIRSGGGFYLTPDARADDGLLDLCLVRAAPLRRILQVLPLALRGRHTEAPEVTMGQARRVRLEAASPVPVHVDGEVLTLGAERVDVEIVPGGLPVLVP